MENEIINDERKKDDFNKLRESVHYPATGIVALEGRMISKAQFDLAFKYWEIEKESDDAVSFEDILLKKDMISPEKMMRLIPATIRKMNVEFGDIAVKKRFLSEAHREKALNVQAEKFKSGELVLLSDLLIKAGLLSEAQRDEVYKIQNKRTFKWVLSYDGSLRYGIKSQNIRKSLQFQLEMTQGELALAYRFITADQLVEGLDLLEKAYRKGLKISLERILHEKGFLDEQKALLLKDAKLFLETRDLDCRFALIAVRDGMIDKDTARKIIAKQARYFKKVHKCISVIDIMLEEQLMTREQCNVILLKQKRSFPDSKGEVDDSKDREIIDEIEEGRGSAGDGLNDSDIGSEIIVNIGSDYMVAEIIIPASYDRAVTKEDVKTLLKERKIVSGIIDDNDLEPALARDASKIRRFIAASGRPPVLGTDARLVVHFQRDYLNPGKMTEDGRIDFKDRGAVPFVSKGDLLVEVIPEKSGIPGKDIYGNVIPALPVNEVTVTAGKGTELSENRCKVFASEDGQPGMTVAGEVSVFQGFNVDGDVDFNTGNIVFDGHIAVKGSVKEGFSVAGGSLTAGAIDGGHVVLKGNLEVSSGIVNAKIRTEGSVLAMYVADSFIESYGDVIVKKEIIDSEIITSGGCKSEGTTIVASTISALKGIEAGQIGTEVSEKCVLRVGVDFHTDNEIKKYMAEIEKTKLVLEEMQGKIEKNEKEQADINETVASTANVMEYAQARLRGFKLVDGMADSNGIDDKKMLMVEIQEAEKAIEKNLTEQEGLMAIAIQDRAVYAGFVSRIEAYNNAIREIRQWVKKQKKEAVLKVRVVHQGSIISGPNASIIIKDACRNCSIREIAGDHSKGEKNWMMRIIPD